MKAGNEAEAPIVCAIAKVYAGANACGVAKA
jgi:hypothetical protein